MAKVTKRKQRTRNGAALPPIPQTTAAGVRARAIADTIRALRPELAFEQFQPLADELGVPALFIQSTVWDHRTDPTNDASIAEYVEWREKLAREAQS